MANFSDGLLWYLAFLASIVFHEAAHALVALWLGDRTALDAGLVTIAPLPHIRREPVGTIVVPILSFMASGWMLGWASTPCNREWARQYPHRSAIMALAGPVANLAMMIVAAMIIRLGLAMDWFTIPHQIGFSSVVVSVHDGIIEGLASLLSIFFSLNLMLFLFNLLPFPPLDGKSLITLFLNRKMAEKYTAFTDNSTVALFGLLIAWKIFPQLYRPLFFMALNLLYP